MRVLFVNCSDYLDVGIPEGIALMSSILKEHGHQVALFDATFLKPFNCSDKINSKKKNMARGIAFYKKIKYSLKDLVNNDPEVDITEKFSEIIEEFKPSLIAVSTMTTNYEKSLKLINSVNVPCKVIFGGVHPTIMPENVIKEKDVDYVCIGEGDKVLLELCEYLEKDKDISRIKNLYIKQKVGEFKNIIKNSFRPFIDLDSLPVPDFSIYDTRHFFRPFLGEIYKGTFMSTSRGCPRGCFYCVNNRLRDIFKECGEKYIRFQSPKLIARNVEYLKEHYGINWIKFSDDTFLMRPLEDIYELKDLLKPLNIMFGCSIDPATVTKEKVEIAEEMGCVSMSIGIETGNEQIRKNVLGRHISNERIKNAINIVKDYGIKISAFNIIGLPGETKENVYETIKFNKELEIPDANVYILYPFPGTKIFKDYGISLDNCESIPSMKDAYIFNLSRMAKSDLQFFLKAFNLYLVLPENQWDKIENAREDVKIYNELIEIAKNIVNKKLSI